MNNSTRKQKLDDILERRRNEMKYLTHRMAMSNCEGLQLLDKDNQPPEKDLIIRPDIPENKKTILLEGKQELIIYPVANSSVPLQINPTPTLVESKTTEKKISLSPNQSKNAPVIITNQIIPSSVVVLDVGNRPILKPYQLCLQKLKIALTPRPLTQSCNYSKLWNFFVVFLFSGMIIINPIVMGWAIFFDTRIWFYLSCITDIFLLVNSYLEAHTIYENEFGVFITDLEQIRHNYLFKNNGIIFIFASIPWDIIVLAVDDSSVGIFKSKARLGAFIRFIKTIVRLPYKKIVDYHIPKLPHVSIVLRNPV